MGSLLDWLAPDVAERSGLERAVALARRLVAGEVAGVAVDVDVARAEAEYDVEVRRVALELCEGLVGLHLTSLLGEQGATSGASWIQSGRADPLWRALLELEERGLGLALPSLPEPNETPDAVALRVLLAAECLGLGAARLELWRAHFRLVTEGPRAACGAYAALAERADLDFATRVEVQVALGQTLLSCGAVARALDWAESVLDLAAAESAVRRVVGWAYVAAGDLQAAAELGLPAPRASLPALIAGLGDQWPAARPVLGGSSAWEGPPRTVAWTGSERLDVGASALVVVRMERWGRVVHVDVAPAIERPGDAWLERQELVALDRAEPEARVLEAGAVWVGFPDAAGDSTARRLERSALTPGARAVALVPLPSSDGKRPLGWLRLEFEHFLVPDAERLRRLAAAWVERLGLEPQAASVSPLGIDHLGALFRAAMEGFALGRRSWYGLGWIDGEWSVLASGGQAFEAPTEALTLGRECLENGRVALAPELEGSVRSALAIPLSGGRYCLTVESKRRGDLGIEDVDGLVMGERGDLRGLGWRLEKTAFADWFRNVEEVELTREWPGLLPCLEALDQAGPGPLLFVGGAGTGKATLAGFHAFLQGERAPVRLAATLDGPGLQELLEARFAVLRDVERSSFEVQAELLRALEAGSAPGLVCTTRGRLDALGERLREALEARRVVLPHLAARRDELPGLFEVCLRRVARLQGCLAPTLTSCAESVVWRQSWERGMHDVLRLARSVVPLAQGAHLSGAELIGLGREVGFELLEKLPTRDFDPRDLNQAIEGTRKRGGAIHRGRAAGRLGWDPDTLSSKLQALGME